ncbi:MAG: stage II sporulation protein R [Firmicutes bacterium]|nr:stage II sporulation protein R [Bacillota bacterium]
MIRTRLLMCTLFLSVGVLLAFLLNVLSGNLNHDTAFAAQNLIRIHVLANSNLPKDQDLKLEVRDAILEETRSLLHQVSQKKQAQEIIVQNQARIEEVAKEVIIAQGFDYPVQVEIGYYPFPTRTYGSLSVPEGWYDAVRVKIGEATGDNWWCVLFPPLCLGDLENGDSGLVEVNQEASEVRVAFRWKIWDQLAQTQYAQTIQKWWQASAASYPSLAD